MQSFAALVWNEHAPRECAAAQRLSEAIRRQCGVDGRRFESPGLAVFDLSPPGGKAQLYPLYDKRGVVFGTMRETGPGPARSLTMDRVGEDRRIVETDGRHLATAYWGSYTAFIRNARGSFIVNDPTGALPCFHMRQDGVTVAFSHLERCAFLDKSAFSINWDFIASLLVYDKIPQPATGLNEVAELLGGQRLSLVGENRRTDFVWDPREFALNAPEPLAEDAAEELALIVSDCVRESAKSRSHILLNLSGGLDSSIVLSCLQQLKEAVRVTPVHHRSAAGDVCELAYAQAAARHCGADLVIQAFSPDSPLPDPARHPLTPRPYRNFLGLNDIEPQCELAKELGVDAFFTGQGGDHLFYQKKTNLTYADFLQRRGYAHAFGRELLNAARLSQTSIWKTMRDAAQHRKVSGGDRLTISLAAYKNALNEHVYERLDQSGLAHEWLKDDMGLPPAKFDQIEAILHMMHVREPFGRCEIADVVHPLIAQPLIEFSLRTPTYILTQGGERGLARAAFENAIPDIIRRRRTKGASSKHHTRRIAYNRSRMADLLCDGVLAREGLLAREKLQSFLRSEAFAIDKNGVRALKYYAIESWLQNWTPLVREPARGAAWPTLGYGT